MWACAKQRFDVIFLDIQMPGMDGYDVCKRVRGDRLNKNAKVFMLTSRSGTFDKVRGKLAGCDLYLTKPVDPMRLNEIIEAEIDARRKAVSPAVGIQPAPGLAMSGSA
jgi:two-component system, cell cycle response regulator